MKTAEGIEIVEFERGFYLHRAKHELYSKRDQCKELEAAYPKDSKEYLRAWAEWMITAKIYNTVKRLTVGERK